MHTVKILIVTDGGGGYQRPTSVPQPGNTAFHLGEFVQVLQDTDWVGFNLQITRAHRRNPAGAGADVVDLRFDTHDLSQYDEILLFPIERDDTVASRATAAEVQAISDFMDAGGGVFATGDHEDLGAGLCRELPRVRSMRRWYYPSAGPDGLPAAPSGGSADRHDTTREGFEAQYQFSDQSDTIAQEITPSLYFGGGNRYFLWRYPHPLLCSPDGVVRHLPDHPHEGLCEVPANLALPVLGQDEYPILSGSTRLAPEVVATGRVIGGHNLVNNSGSEVKPVVNEKTFGVIGAYDGHRIVRGGKRLGRVVVDSTWHHFFNVNLIGAQTAGTDGSGGNAVKERGFYAPLNPGQADHYRMIRHYFRNIVYWLIPAGRYRWIIDVFDRFVASPFFYEEFRFPFRDHVKIPIRVHFGLAQLAEQYFSSVHGACSVPLFVGVLWREIPPLRPVWEQLQPLIDPWSPGLPQPRPGPDPLPWAPQRPDPKDLLRLLLGITVAASVLAQRELEGSKAKDLTAKRAELFEQLLPKVADHAIGEFREALRAQKKEQGQHLEEMDALMGVVGKRG